MRLRGMPVAVSQMSNVTPKAVIALFGLVLIATIGCGKSAGMALTSGSGGAGSGGADAKGSGGTPGGTGEIGTGGAATGGNGTGGIGVLDGGGGGRADASSGGSGGSGGSAPGTGGVRLDGGATGGTGGNIGLDGAVAGGCPPAPPAKGDHCSQDPLCYYEDCAGSGRTVAFCSSGVWQVSTGACSSTTCQSFNPSVAIACPAGQICLAIYGQAPVCATQTCGTGPVGAGCVSGAAGSCHTTEGSVTDGISVRCCLSAGTSC